MHTQNTHAYTIYIMLSHNCTQIPAVGAYIHARACATTHTHVHYLYTHTCAVAHA